MQYQLVFLDVDGTIFRYEDGIRPLVQKGLKTIRKKGIELIINTGRARGLLPEALEEKDFDGFITGSGNRVEYKGKVIFSEQIADAVIGRLLAEKDRLAFTLETENFAYMTPKMAELQNRIHAGSDSQLLKFRGNKYVIADTIGRYSAGIPVGKVCYLAETTKEAERLGALLGEDFFTVSERQQGLLYCEAVPQNCGKGKGVLRLCSFLRIDPKNTIAFGDGQNDLDMLGAVGTGVAMANAAENVKSAAKHVCPAIGADGVYHGLRDLGLLVEE